ncbi:cytochrome c biogenesis protein ResB [Carboxydocella sp. ULO1]|uniref:cytochrome c biogenesis protein ResB n=1 Tax=Carboxydocella sp. ULO1 TaxID=1926599 RepID=UPI0013564588|nr:cytochrome c biogenesis protein ResB [Carboxydocella sp. ULO1]
MARGLPSGQYDTAFFRSLLLQVLLLLLLLNTAACMVAQVRKRWLLYQRLKKAARIYRWRQRKRIEGDARSWLTRQGFRPLGTVVWARRVYGLAFIILFHFSFLLIGLGYLWSAWGRIEGLVPITTGEQVQLTRDAYSLLQLSTYSRLNTDNWRLQVDQVLVNYPARGWPQDVQGRFQLWNSNIQAVSGILRKVPPVSYRGYDFNVWDFGFAPYLEISQEGQELLSGYVSLATLTRDNQKFSRDTLLLPNGKEMVVEFLPRGLDGDWGKPDKFMYPSEPLVKISSGGQSLVLPLNSSGELGQFKIKTGDFRYYLQVKIIKDYGMVLIFIAFWLGLGALAGHYLLPASFACIGHEGEKEVIYLYTWSTFPLRRTENEH